MTYIEYLTNRLLLKSAYYKNYHAGKLIKSKVSCFHDINLKQHAVCFSLLRNYWLSKCQVYDKIMVEKKKEKNMWHCLDNK